MNDCDILNSHFLTRVAILITRPRATKNLNISLAAFTYNASCEPGLTAYGLICSADLHFVRQAFFIHQQFERVHFAPQIGTTTTPTLQYICFTCTLGL